MAERKAKRDETGTEFGPEEANFVMESAKVEVGSGYALSVHYDEHEKPVIDVKTYGTVDIDKIQKEIERIFPDGRIRNMAQPEPVTIVKKEKKKRRK